MTPEQKLNQKLTLLDQIIEIAKHQAKELDEYNLARHKASKTVGQNSMVFHLQNLRELIIADKPETLGETVKIGDDVLQVALG